MSRARYEVKGKDIIAKMDLLGEKDLKVIKNYIALGYNLIEYKKEKKETKDCYTQKAVEEWLKENATEEQIEEYNKIYNEPTKDKETGEPILKKDGKPKVKGFIATFHWLRKTFPNYPETNK